MYRNNHLAQWSIGRCLYLCRACTDLFEKPAFATLFDMREHARTKHGMEIEEFMMKHPQTRVYRCLVECLEGCGELIDYDVTSLRDHLQKNHEHMTITDYYMTHIADAKPTGNNHYI